jgi:ADP-heptose:LPS heptosyltransferase
MSNLHQRAADVVSWALASSPAAVDTVLSDRAHPAYALAEDLADAADHADEAQRGAGLGALFGGLVEPLNDAFSLSGRQAYARLFTAVTWRAGSRNAALREQLARQGITDEAGLYARYAQVRRADAPVPGTVRRICVLSRVTIGADILLTSVAIQRLAQRWPQAEIVLLGDGKLAPLLGGGTPGGTGGTLPAIRVRHLAYSRRGGLGERLAAWLAVRAAIDDERPDLVVSPDSRLDQLGILPSADAGRHILWENTQDGPARSLADTCDAWFARRLGLPPSPGLTPLVAIDQATRGAAAKWAKAFAGQRWLAVKLDHGGNAAKALPRDAEVRLLRAARAAGWRILLDRGFGAAELAGSDSLLADLGWTALDVDDTGLNTPSGCPYGMPVDRLAPIADHGVVRFHGSIAGWAAAVSACSRAFSYDSVGHHLAAALGIPVAVAFTGHSDDAFPLAWQPRGRTEVALVVIPTAEKAEPAQIARVEAAIGSP